jgi:hypothetical protein
MRTILIGVCVASCDFACCMTGPKESDEPIVGPGVNVSRVDYDNDLDIDLRDYAELQKRLDVKR